MNRSDLPAVRETRIGAYGICIEDGRILLIRKARGPYTGLFDLPGGGIEFGEAPADAVVREFLEETGVAVHVGGIAGVFHRHCTFVADSGDKHIEQHHMGFLYRVAPVGPGRAPSTAPDGLDSLGALWLPLEEARPELISPLVVEGLRCI